MNIKTKITLGFLLLLTLLLGVGAYSLGAVRQLDQAARHILQANFYSVQMGQEMHAALNLLSKAQQRRFLAPAGDSATEEIHIGLARFETALTQEAGNITEPGERELVAGLQQNFATYRNLVEAEPAAGRATYFARTLPTHHQLSQQTAQVVQLNESALTRKNAESEKRAADIERNTILLLAFSSLFALLFVFSVPEAAVSGLRKLSSSIDAATRNEFTGTIPEETNDEFGVVARAFNRMLVQLHGARNASLAELVTERNRAASIVEHLDEGLLLLDADRCVLLANPTAAALLGQPAPALTEMAADELATQSELFHQLRAYLETPKAQRPAEAPQLAVPNAVEPAEPDYYRLATRDVVAFNPARDQMEFLGTVVTLQNVSEFRRLDRAKSDFLATVSHELKTPLSSINFNLKLLQDQRIGPVNHEQQEILGSIKQENQRLLRLVGELLEVGKLESGAIPLQLEAVPVAELVAAAAQAVQLQLRPQQLQLDVDLPADLPAVRADREKTTWVLVNLLANAIRFSPPGGRVVVRAQAGAGRTVECCVEDQGPGIALDLQEQIFRRYAQGPSPGGEPAAGGTGLGLSIAREFLAAQQGRLWVDSQPGQGSRFYLALPVA
ncbi:HAMP domain-containing protein [Hymenobacter sp. BT683]|uniref:histidine kinase n=1 Tax=Hymenobacter jeongseonensis TaxID=2791027 RepID=A0ABS0IKA2_9BACT|nr:ATP-binding protein [Hymenobacter jeongseonensis]MBF9238587.1 HAMP domain-containing protein [Hymenobacter jeongseonensis]